MLVRILGIVGLFLLIPAAAFTSFLWIYGVVGMAWERSLGFGKDLPTVFLMFALSIFLIRWSVTLGRYLARHRAA